MDDSKPNKINEILDNILKNKCNLNLNQSKDLVLLSTETFAEFIQKNKSTPFGFP